MYVSFTSGNLIQPRDSQTDLVQYPEGGEESDHGDAGRREKELCGRKPVSQQERRREEVKLGLRTVQGVPAFVVWIEYRISGYGSESASLNAHSTHL